jgi:hypothetical protein
LAGGRLVGYRGSCRNFTMGFALARIDAHCTNRQRLQGLKNNLALAVLNQIAPLV